MKRFCVKLILVTLGGLLLPALLGAGPRQSSPGSKPVPAQDLTALKSAGSREAPVTIEVFSDHQCPQCRCPWKSAAAGRLTFLLGACCRGQSL